MLFKVTPKRKRTFLKELFEWISVLAIAFIITLFIISNIGTLTQIKEQSMEPTFVENERVIVNKIGYLIGKPKREDIVILSKNNRGKGLLINMVNEFYDIKANIIYRFTGIIEKNNLIKRVIGLPGDTIDIKDGNVYINNIKEEGNYFVGKTFAESNINYPVEIPEGKVFVLGDNREYSLDSRSLGLIEYEQLKGKVFLKIWPVNRIGFLR